MIPDAKSYMNNRGIALIITLTVITILVAVTFELNRQIQAAATDSSIVRDRLTVSHMIKSGINIAESILIADKNESEIDSLQEDWANPEKIDAYLSNLIFDEGNILLDISDELGRIQVNSLVAFPKGRDFNAPQKDFWYRFVGLILLQQQDNEAFMEEIVEPGAIINSVKDWLDSGDNDAITGLNGAEKEYYQDQEPSYLCRNGPFRYIEELTRVKGITPELFYSADQQLLGISRYVTVQGISQLNDKFTYDGKININTADLPVIAALLPAGQDFLAPEIYDYRIESADGRFLHDLNSPTWYKDVPGCSDVEIKGALLTTSSDVFRIECSAVLHDIHMTSTVIVKREKDSKSGKWFCKVLNWKNE
ncbi:MAG: general secretion pathway protein GspK [Dissulfuribacterales bacterium]